MQAFTFATSKLKAAAVLSASYRPDMIHSYNEGFIGTAYTAAHEAVELLLKLYLRHGPVRVPPTKSHGHDLGKLFEAWDFAARNEAEIKYQRDILGDLTLNRFPQMAPGTKFGPTADSNQLGTSSLTVRDVLEELDAELSPRCILRLCPSYSNVFDGFSCPPETWYPEELLSKRWEQFVKASRQGASLGFIEAFLKREGTKTVFEGWRYLSELKLSKLGMVFDGPPAKMILIGQSLQYLIWGMVDGAVRQR